MPVRWSALKVSEAMEMVEEQVNLAIPYLEQARIIAREARNIPNLPQYVDDVIGRVLLEIERAIGGSQSEPIGRLRAVIESVRKSIPHKALEAEEAKQGQGKQQALI